MNNESFINRRSLLRGSVATAAVVGVGGLAACATGGPGGDTSTPPPGGDTGAPMDPTNPFGLEEGATIDAFIFDGGYGTDYVDYAAEQLNTLFPDVTVTVKPSTDIAGELQPRFVGGTPPDLVDNSGAKAIGFGTILEQLSDLDTLLEAPNYEGTPIKDTLYPGVTAPGTFGGRFVAMNYVFALYAVWYSQSLFEENGWTPPTTWDEAIDLGQQAKEKDKYLFLWGREAATYYQTMAIESAIKQGGDEVRLALENIEEGCWSHPAIQSVFEKLHTIVSEGMFKPGGSGTQFTAAQAQWTNNQDALLYPSGSWIENEMKSQTKEGFELVGVPTPVVDSSSAMPYESLHSAAGEPFVVPTKAQNAAGGFELMRAMLSEKAAAKFAQDKFAPTVVADTVPDDGFGSTALVSQTAMLEAAGENSFDFKFVNLYGINADMLTVWNSFLDGQDDVAGLTSRLQKIVDDVRNDPNVEKVPVQ